MEKRLRKKFRLENSIQAYGCICICGCSCACGIFTNQNNKDASNDTTADSETSSYTLSKN